MASQQYYQQGPPPQQGGYYPPQHPEQVNIYPSFKLKPQRAQIANRLPSPESEINSLLERKSSAIGVLI